MTKFTRRGVLPALGLLAIVLVLTFHRQILRTVPLPLQVRGTVTTVSVLALWNGDQRHEFAAGQLNEGKTQRVLLFSHKKRWAEKCGAERDATAISKERLGELGLNSDQIVLLAEDAHDIWDGADRLAAWLAKHPHDTVALTVDGLYGRTAQVVMRRVVQGPASERLHIVGLPHRDQDLENWWKTRKGLLSVFNNYIWLGHTLIVGRTSVVVDSWDPDEFERSLHSQLAPR